jgi:hypothetical protein
MIKISPASVQDKYICHQNGQFRVETQTTAFRSNFPFFLPTYHRAARNTQQRTYSTAGPPSPAYPQTTNTPPRSPLFSQYA